MGAYIDAVMGLAVARWRHVWRLWVPGMAALAVLAAMPALVTAVGTATDAAALQHALLATPVDERSVTVTVSQRLDATAYAATDQAVTAAMPQVATGPLRRQMVYRPLAAAAASTAATTTESGTVILAGTDQVDSAVRLTSGRWPAVCAPNRCEVLALTLDTQSARSGPTPTAASVPVPPGLGLLVVGTADRLDPLLLGGTFAPEPGVPVLLGEGVGEVSEISALAGFGRSTGWTATIDAGTLTRTGATRWLTRMSEVTDDLAQRTDGAVTVDAPVALIADKQARAEASSDRFVVLSASIGVLLLGTAVLSGASISEDHRAWTTMLRRRGARPRLIRAVTAVEVLTAAALGALAGTLLGMLVQLALAHTAQLPLAEIAWSATKSTLTALIVIAVATAALSALALSHRISAQSAAALAAVALLGVLVVLAGGDRLGADSPALLLLPGLFLIMTGAATAAGWTRITQTVAGWLPRDAVAARLALGASPARSIRPAVTAGLLAAALAASLFAASYRHTLRTGAADEAAYLVPAQAVLNSTATGMRPGDLLGPGVDSNAAPAHVDAIRHAVASIRTADGGGAAVGLIGVPPAALTRMPRWESVTGSRTAPALVVPRLTVPPDAVPRGMLLPAGSTRLRITAPTAAEVVVTAYLVGTDGKERGLPLVWQGNELTAELPTPSGDRWQLTEITVRQPTDATDKRQHNLGEGGKDREAAEGNLVLSAVETNIAAVTKPWAAWSVIGTDNGSLDPRAAAPGEQLAINFALRSGRLILSGRSGVSGDSAAKPLPALVDSVTAKQARDGLITLRLNGGALTLRVAGVLDRFPRAAAPGAEFITESAQGRFAVVDGDALAVNVDRREPGTGQADQIWLNGLTAKGIAALSQPPRAALNPVQRAVVQDRLLSDPVARAASGLLTAMSLLVLTVAFFALLGLSQAERRDDRARLVAWEAEGLTPPQLRAVVRWRTLAVALPAVVVGVVGGAALGTLTARLVALTAAGGTPIVPLRPGLNGTVLLVVFAIAAATAVVLAWLLAAPVARGLSAVPRTSS